MHENQLLALAARQQGLAHRQQISELGFSRAAFRQLIDTGRWRWLTPTVLVLCGSPESPEQSAMAAVLDLNPNGAALSHQTAAATWGLPGFSVRPHHVIGDRIRGRNRAHLGVVHQPRLLLPDHILLLNGIPIVSPTLTLIHLAGTLRWPQQVERTVDNALAARLTSVALLRSTFNRCARRGRAGTKLMRELLDARSGHYVPPASGLESRFQTVARWCGYTKFVRQVNVGNDYDWLGRVDFVDRELRIIVEVQSSRFHGSLIDTQRDRARIAAMRLAGWIVVEVLEHDLWHDPEKVMAQLRNARRR